VRRWKEHDRIRVPGVNGPGRRPIDLQQACSCLPVLVAQIDVVVDVAALVDISDKATPSVDVWQQIGGAVAQFAGKLLAHETEESRILQQGFNEDPALFDLEENR
jgi:hypothetical protein